MKKIRYIIGKEKLKEISRITMEISGLIEDREHLREAEKRVVLTISYVNFVDAEREKLLTEAIVIIENNINKSIVNFLKAIE